MGLLVDGVWQDHDRDIAGAGGSFARTSSTFRNWVTADGAPGPGGAGANSVRFRGRIGGRVLRPGGYRMTLTPAGGSAAGAPFRIVR